MNFFTKPVDHTDMLNLCCNKYSPGVYNPIGQTSTLLNGFKLIYSNRDIVLLDPYELMSAFFCLDGWQDGWTLVLNEMTDFMNQFGPTKDMNLSLVDLKDRTDAFSILSKDKPFVRTALRLKLINIIENLE